MIRCGTFRDAAFRLRPTNGTAVFQKLFRPPQLSGLATAVSDALLSTCTCYLRTLRLVPRQNDLPRQWCASEYTIWLLVSRRGRKRCPRLFCPRPTNNDSALPLVTQLPRTLLFSAAPYLIARARAIGDVIHRQDE